jgi:hypothetical protein
MIAGWVYYRFIHRARWLRSEDHGVEIEPPKWMQKAPKAPLANAPQLDLTRREDLRAEVDRILDKINSDGFGALTADEKRLLDEARDLLSRR